MVSGEAGKRRFTILHSNDMHGDFLAEMRGAKGNLIGGLALLSGYITRVRQEEENVAAASTWDPWSHWVTSSRCSPMTMPWSGSPSPEPICVTCSRGG